MERKLKRELLLTLQPPKSAHSICAEGLTGESKTKQNKKHVSLKNEKKNHPYFYHKISL